jgi:hypothetical protein
MVSDRDQPDAVFQLGEKDRVRKAMNQAPACAWFCMKRKLPGILADAATAASTS